MAATADMQGDNPSPHIGSGLPEGYGSATHVADEDPTCDLSEQPLSVALSVPQKRRERVSGNATAARGAGAFVKRSTRQRASSVTRLTDRASRGAGLPVDPRGEITQLIEKTMLLEPPGWVPPPRAPVPSLPSSASFDERSEAAALRASAGLVEQAPATATATATRDDQARSSHTPMAESAPEEAPLPPGHWLCGRYELQTLLGRGGMASVYRAIDHDRARLGLEDHGVAVKVVESNASRPAVAAVLLQEFQSAQRLSHPNIINVFDIDREGERTFYSMELLSGARLSQLLRRVDGAPLQEHNALAIIRDIGAAIAHAHSRGVVHADLKPSNVMITQDGEVRVLDFGGQSMPPREPWISAGDNDDAYHHATPAYASCEQLERKRADPRDDIYALGCIAFLLLSGKHPFEYLSSIEARAKGMRPRRPSGMPARRWKALRQSLSWAREDRPADIEPWLAMLGLESAAARLPPLTDLTAAGTAGRRWPGAGIAAVVAAVAAGIILFVLFQQEDLTRSIQNGSVRAQHWLEQITHGAPASSPSPTAHLSGAQVPHVGSLEERAASVSATRDKGKAVAAPMAVASASALASSPAPAPATADSPGPHVAFTSPEYRVGANDPAARIVIQRTPGTRGDVNFIWWTVPGSAEPDVDYAALGARTEHLQAGQDRTTIYVPIISKPQRRASSQFEVLLADDASHRSAAGAASARAIVTIPADRY